MDKFYVESRDGSFMMTYPHILNEDGGKSPALPFVRDISVRTDNGEVLLDVTMIMPALDIVAHTNLMLIQDASSSRSEAAAAIDVIGILCNQGPQIRLVSKENNLFFAHIYSANGGEEILGWFDFAMSIVNNQWIAFLTLNVPSIHDVLSSVDHSKFTISRDDKSAMLKFKAAANGA